MAAVAERARDRERRGQEGSRVRLATAILLVVGVTIVATSGQRASALAPATGVRQPIIVELADTADVGQAASSMASRFGGTLHRLYGGRGIKGFAGWFPANALDQLRHEPSVIAAEPDGLATIAQATSTQTGADWGLDRIDQRSLPLSGTYDYTETGSGVTVYVLDNGVRITHTDFGGRATSGYDFVDNDANADDECGHGTHTAGTVAGTAYGVAKQAHVVAVRVIACTGSTPWSTIVAGINWVVNTVPSGTTAVMNLSLVGPPSQTVDDAVTRAVAAGIVVVVAAGNAMTDACTESPARTPAALTVAATTSTDARASYSNYGSCIDLFAPGDNIRSDFNTSDTATAVMSGTSMAAPHVAGVAAQYLQLHPNASASSVGDAIVAAATNGVVTDARSAQSGLLYNRFTQAAVAPGAPTSVSAAAGNKSATVNWNAPANDGGSAITGYTVTSNPGGITATTAGTTTSTSVTGLTNGTTYTFTVTATNAIGTGPPSSPSNAVTPAAPATAPQAPTNVTAAAGDKSATVNWTAPANDGGSAITGYTVTPTPGGGSIGVDGAARNATITGLTDGTTYTFTVTATNAAGTGPPSKPSNPVTPTGSPLLVVAPTSVDFADRRLGLTTDARTITVSNTGDAVASLGGLTENGRAEDFPVRGGTCLTTGGSLRDNLAPGTSCSLDFAFSPTDVGARSVDLRLGIGGGPELTLTGNGTEGYYLATTEGKVLDFGDAAPLGGLDVRLNAPIVGASATSTGDGVWLLGTDGGIFSFGDAAFHGSTGNMRLNRPVLGLAPTPTGEGYWLVASDGGIFAFGDAAFYGSTGNIHLNQPIVGMAATPTGRGYWLVASDGGIFAFGDAGFYGSTGNIHLNQPIIAIAATPRGDGYWMVAADGGIFSFNAPYFGSGAGSGAQFAAIAPTVSHLPPDILATSAARSSPPARAT